MSVTPLLLRLSENLQSVRNRIHAAAGRSGRTASEVQLVAVTKYTTWPAILGLVDLGFRDFGENRPQQLLDRAATLATDRPAAVMNWHLIGQLQRNKVRSVLPTVKLIHSIDSLRLLERVDQIATELGITPEVLLQVNVSGEGTKSGFTAEEFQAALRPAATLSSVRIVGLMTMAPLTENENTIRATFRGLRELRDRCSTAERPLPQLSMGMSGDFEIAIEEGATLVRVGSALFDGCESPA